VLAGSNLLAQVAEAGGGAQAVYPGADSGEVPVKARGWYRDPCCAHEDRYFSGGQPTRRGNALATWYLSDMRAVLASAWPTGTPKGQAPRSPRRTASQG
jgi:hypothetical protein